MILYHGSNVSIERIDLTLSKPNKDFGQGFYLSENISQANEMAIFKSNLLGGSPIVTAFEFNEDAMYSKELKTKIFHEYSNDWADFVFANREGLDVEKFDIVYGPIANDKVGLQIRKLKDGTIDKIEFLNRLKYMKGITFQYFFGSMEALKSLKRL